MKASSTTSITSSSKTVSSSSSSSLLTTPPDMDLRLLVYQASTAFFYTWQMVFAMQATPWYPWVLLRAAVAFGFIPLNHPVWKRIVMAIFLLVHFYQTYQRCPSVWDSDMWAMQSDVVMALWLICTADANTTTMMVRGNNSSADRPLCVLRAIRDMFTWFYLAAGFWKLNSHFWNPTGSCATMFVIQILSYYIVPFLSSWATAVQVGSWSKAYAPLFTLIVELGQAIGLLLGLCLFGGNSSSSSSGKRSATATSPTRLIGRRAERIGICVTLLFHLAVCLVPQPNDISGFAFQCASRLIVFASVDGTRKTLQLFQQFKYTLMGIGVAISSYGWTWFTPMNWAFLGYSYIGPFVFLAVVMSDEKEDDSVSEYIGGSPLHEGSNETNTKGAPAEKNGNSTYSKSHQPLHRTWWMFLASFMAFAYSFLGILTGVLEEATPNMFANLKVHGGSNHFLLPTGLFFHWYSEAPDSHPWGGGVIRIENTTSTWMSHTYPADLTSLLQPAPTMTQLMEDIGSPPPSYFNPGASRILRLTPPPKKFIRYTVPAIEFKRLLREAKEYDGTFEVVYAQLPGTKGDEIWRASAVERWGRVVAKDGIVVECELTDSKTGKVTPCKPGVDIPLVADDSVPWILQRFSMHHAYPIVTDTLNELPSTIVCFGP